MRILATINTWLCVAVMSICMSCEKTGSIIKPELLPAPTIYIGGANEILTIPAATTRNVSYSVDESAQQVHINIVIGRSGYEEHTGFSMDAVVSNDSVSNLINEGMLTDVILMEEDMYELIETVQGDSKTGGGYIQLKLHMDVIGDIGRKKLALGVKIQNASKYQINPLFEEAILLIDYRAMVGVGCLPDVDVDGRMFFNFETSSYRDTWYDGGVQSTLLESGKIRLIRDNDDGYGLFVLRDNNYTYNLDTHPIVGVRIFSTPSEGSWWLRVYNGTRDFDLQPDVATIKTLDDGSKIYYWNMPERTGLSGIVSSNAMIVVIGARGQSMTHGWIRSYEEAIIIDQCVTN